MLHILAMTLDNEASSVESMEQYKRLWRETKDIHGFNEFPEPEDFAIRDELMMNAMSIEHNDSLDHLLEHLNAPQSSSTVPNMLSEIKAFYSRCFADIATFGQDALSHGGDLLQYEITHSEILLERFNLYLQLAMHLLLLDQSSDNSPNNTNNNNSNSNNINTINANDNDKKKEYYLAFSELTDSITEEATTHILRIIKECPQMFMSDKSQDILLIVNLIPKSVQETNARSYHSWMIVGEVICQAMGHCYVCHKASPQLTTNTTTSSNTTTATSTTVKACSACHVVPYCSSECQRADWSRHKLVCKQHASLSI